MKHDLNYYKTIGFKSGLEIHQRLATEKKLFCSCSAQLKADQKVKSIERRQRAVAGELGVLDRSTSFESQKGRRFIYNIFKETTCLVDIDEEPPHKANKDALDIGIQIAASFNAAVPDEMEPMRKEVVDGSDPSAFQRSILIGYDGYIKINGKEVPIPSVFLEEESSGIEISSSESVVYNIDRLGIPLIEIDTDPVIATPQEAKEVAIRIGLLLRLTGKVQRGLGSIRQDVNVSITDGARVEIKGFQDINSIDTVIDNEIYRQQRLIEIKKELKKRGAEVGEPVDITSLFADTNAKLVKETIKSGGSVFGLALREFKGMLGYEINENRRLGSEIGEYAKSAGVGGLIHSDEDLNDYGFEKSEMESIAKKLKLGANDAFIMIAGKRDRAENAIQIAKQRSELALLGVPSETRGVDPRYLITKFLRPIPGGSRMYPETDVLPIVANGLFDKFKKSPIDVKEIESRLEKELNNKQLAQQLLWSKDLQLYSEIIEMTKAKPIVVASILLEKFKELERSGVKIDDISDEVITYIFGRFADGEITRVAIEELLKRLPKNVKEVEAIIKARQLRRLSGRELEKLLEKYKGKPKGDTLREIMSQFRLNVDGEELKKMLG